MCSTAISKRRPYAYVLQKTSPPDRIRRGCFGSGDIAFIYSPRLHSGVCRGDNPYRCGLYAAKKIKAGIPRLYLCSKRGVTNEDHHYEVSRIYLSVASKIFWDKKGKEKIAAVLMVCINMELSHLLSSIKKLQRSLLFLRLKSAK